MPEKDGKLEKTNSSSPIGFDNNRKRMESLCQTSQTSQKSQTSQSKAKQARQPTKKQINANKEQAKTKRNKPLATTADDSAIIAKGLSERGKCKSC